MKEKNKAMRENRAADRALVRSYDFQQRPMWWKHSITVKRAHVIYPMMSLETIRNLCVDRKLKASKFCGQWMIEEKFWMSFIKTLPQQKELSF